MSWKCPECNKEMSVQGKGFHLKVHKQKYAESVNPVLSNVETIKTKSEISEKLCPYCNCIGTLSIYSVISDSVTEYRCVQCGKVYSHNTVEDCVASMIT